MEPDYPAAHSMDTWWFAMDADGCVGVFFTYETGHLPSGTAGQDLVSVLSELRGNDDSEDEEDVNVDEAWGEWLAEAAERGMFVYEYIDRMCQLAEYTQWPYTLTHEPDNPVHVDQLPPRLRTLFKAIHLNQSRFQDNDLLQPSEHIECYCWNPEADVAYLAADEKTVKPIPGKEERFAQFVSEFRQRFPDEANQFVFEGPQEKPKDPRRPPQGE